MKRPLCLLCLAFVTVLVVCLKLTPMELPDWSSLDGRGIRVEGQVYRKEYKTVRKSQVLVIYLHSAHILKESGGSGRSEPSNQFPDHQIQNIICYLEEGSGPEPGLGSSVRLEGRVSCFTDAGNPGEFDMKKYCSIQKLDFRLDQARILSIGGEEKPLQEGLFRLRNYFAGVLDRTFGEKEASVMKAMLLGEKNGLDQETKELYQENSILHILSISGLHISIIGMGMYRLLRRCGAPLRPAALLCMPVICAYGVMTGMSMSAIRAVFMFLVHLGADVMGRSYDMITALAMAAVVLLAGQPLYVEHSGFLFSFGAVAAIGIFMPALYEGRKGAGGRLRRLSEKWKQSLASCVSVFLATLPVQLFFYYQFPIYSVLLNLAVIPLMTVVMGAGLLCMILGGMWPLLTAPAAGICRAILRFYEACCLLCERIPGGRFEGGQPEDWQVLTYLALLGILVGVRKRTTLFWKTQWLLGALCLLLLRYESGLQITVLDVGQGDCIHIRSGSGQHYLIDGGSSTKSSVEKYQILPFLRSRGVGRLEAVFVTHSDMDHCSGILSLLEEYSSEKMEIGSLILPDIHMGMRDGQYEELVSLAGKNGIRVLYMSRGQFLEEGGMRLSCIHPRRGYTAGNANESSLVLYLSYGSFSGLFTGDIEGEGEQEVWEYLKKSLKTTEGGRLTLLKAAHHGSRNSTDEELLAGLRPRLALISSGKDNRYGHPHQELLERLEAAGCRIYQTPVHGAITVETDGRECRVDTWRK